MFRSDDAITDLGHIDAAVEFAPQAIQQSAVLFQAGLVSIQIMLEIVWQTKLICQFTLRMMDAPLIRIQAASLPVHFHPPIPPHGQG